jgi:hypothetical protein
MTPDELTCRLNSLYTAADVVEAIDNPELGRTRRWDLSRWRYDLVPWGVRFTHLDPLSRNKTEVLALMAIDDMPETGVGDGKAHVKVLLVP